MALFQWKRNLFTLCLPFVYLKKLLNFTWGVSSCPKLSFDVHIAYMKFSKFSTKFSRKRFLAGKEQCTMDSFGLKIKFQNSNIGFFKGARGWKDAVFRCRSESAIGFGMCVLKFSGISVWTFKVALFEGKLPRKPVPQRNTLEKVTEGTYTGVWLLVNDDWLLTLAHYWLFYIVKRKSGKSGVFWRSLKHTYIYIFLNINDLAWS